MTYSSCLATLYNSAQLWALLACVQQRQSDSGQRLRDLGPRRDVVIKQGERKITVLFTGTAQQRAAPLFVLWTLIEEVQERLAMGQKVSTVSLWWRVVEVHEMRKWGSAILEDFIV